MWSCNADDGGGFLTMQRLSTESVPLLKMERDIYHAVYTERKKILRLDMVEVNLHDIFQEFYAKALQLGIVSSSRGLKS